MSTETENKTQAKSIPQIWLFPTETAQVFAGWDPKNKMFVFGCVVPETVREITYWPGSVKVPNVEIPTTVMLQHMPLMGKGLKRAQGRVPGTEIACDGCYRLGYSFIYGSTLEADTKQHGEPHLADNVTSHFSIYQLFKRKKKSFIRRLVMGNNKKNSHKTITSLICWSGVQGQLKCLREAHNKFWSNYFSFSYTGKEKSLDDPDGYQEFLHSYKKKAHLIAKCNKDREINLIEMLKKLNPLLTSIQPHDGVSVDYSEFPGKNPRISWADKKDGVWYINQNPQPEVTIQLGFSVKK